MKKDQPKNGKDWNAPSIGNLKKTLGPVSDLERHLPQEWWQTLFNAVYLKTDGDVVENDSITKSEITKVIELTGIKPSDSVLDLCCGQGRHLLELARRSYLNLNGYDRSQYLIRLARSRAKKEGFPIQFKEGDARRKKFAENSMDCVTILGNSFGYFEKAEDDLKVLKNVYTCLRSDGKLLLDLTDGNWVREHYQARSWEWIDQNQFVCRERSLSSDRSRLISREVVVDSEKGVIADQFYAERLYSRPEIEALLHKSGFKNIAFHSEYRTESERNQDLGMMEQRIFITASVPEKPRCQPKKVSFPKVTVLLGDPSLPDAVKLNGKFNPEDLETVQKLKDALATLKEFQFTYWDNHSQLLKQLQNTPPSFVFNHCDEGFRNYAHKELHVPAMLELLNIPYTGAGPTSLGLCYDKSMVNSIANTIDIPVPMETYIDSGDMGGTLPSVFPALIKPATGDSSIGITSKALVHNTEEAMDYINKLQKELPGRAILVQEYLTGKEFSVSLVGNEGQTYTVLPILEVDFSELPKELPPILSYESKWQPDSPYSNTIKYKEADTDEETLRLLTNYSKKLFERFGCRDYARFDFRCDEEGNPKLLEINPNPGWCWDGKMNLMADMAGMTYAELLMLILESAQTRVQNAGV